MLTGGEVTVWSAEGQTQSFLFHQIFRCNDVVMQEMVTLLGHHTMLVYYFLFSSSNLQTSILPGKNEACTTIDLQNGSQD